MPKKTSIPVNAMADEYGAGIAIEKLSFNELSLLDQLTSEEGQQSHRHDSHSFFLLESGSVNIELDFEKYTITAPSVIYIHPDQVHRTTSFENVTVSSLAMNNENLTAEYLSLLESITPVQPLVLDKETFSILSETAGICMKFYERKSDRLYHSTLKDSCNAFVALVISQYLANSKPADKLSRFEIVTKSFRELLERNYKLAKRPADYAQKLNISTPYLNECVKNATGYPVSHHIQQRIILEAKRLLYHSDTSVKEIAAVLGYDDYPYFSRLFTKATGMTALTFRNKNLD